MKTYPLSALVFDFDLYPRGSVDSQHVSEITVAMQAGVAMPPLVIDAKSKRVIDGFHRGRAYKHLFGEDHKIECVEKAYKSEKDMFIDAMRYNAAHGRALTQHDRAHCILLAKKFEIDNATLATALNVTPERIGELTASRIGSVSGRPIALKQTIRHKAGQELTSQQASANDKLSGMNQLFYVNQLVTLIENDLIDTDNEDLIKGLEHLARLLKDFSKRKAA